MGPAENLQMAIIARRYFIDGRSKVQIATEYGISRFKVARILETALAEGVVRIEIDVPGTWTLTFPTGCARPSTSSTPSRSPPQTPTRRGRPSSARPPVSCSARSSPRTTSSAWGGAGRSRRWATA